ncbi:lasso peptide biosynthesis B2 protein [Streptomyces roseoverticillatus]|uniref:lasso peptide biosynthesis B2 protein n=1 Tax=Streptomyces roseoverticillatus TaxID=66429 RepID=UPI0034020128
MAGEGGPVNTLPDLSHLITPHATITINYRTGQTKLRPADHTSERPLDGVIVNWVPTGPSWGTCEIPAALPRHAPAPLAWRLAAIPAVLTTTAALLARPRDRTFHRLLRLATVGRALPPATVHQVRCAVRAVRWAAWPLPLRWACLEQSTASALLLALIGRRAEWRHGIALDPIRMHCWIAGPDGHPVDESEDTGLYTVTCTPDGPGPDPGGPKGASHE